MRFYVGSACFIIVILFISIIAQQVTFNNKQFAYDDEQQFLDEQIIVNFSHVVAENTPKGMAAVKFADLVREKSNGEIIVEIHPNGILYNDETEVKALQEGKIQMIAPTISKMTGYMPSWGLLDLPFIFENDEQVYTVLNGELSTRLLTELKSVNIHGLTFWHNGFKQIATQQQPILDAASFHQVRVRTMKSEVLQNQFELLGAIPVTTTFNEIYRQMELGNITAQENTLSNIYSKGFYEQQPNITLSNHGILAYAVMMNQSFWDSLQPKHQQIILEALNEMNDWQYEQALILNEESLQKMKGKKSVRFYELNNVQRQQWKTLLQPIYSNYYGRNYDVLIDEINNSQNDK